VSLLVERAIGHAVTAAFLAPERSTFARNQLFRRGVELISAGDARCTFVHQIGETPWAASS